MAKIGLKLLTVFLIGFFCLGVVEISHAKASKSPKTCCGRVICLCQHSRGDVCPMRKNNQKKSIEERHLPGAMPAAHCHLAQVKKKQKPSENRNIIRLAKAPCSTDLPKKYSSAGVKDFTTPFSEPFYFLADECSEVIPKVTFPQSLVLPRLDPPPKAIF